MKEDPDHARVDHADLRRAPRCRSRGVRAVAARRRQSVLQLTAGIKEYLNWKVTHDTVGEVGFPYFELFVLEDGADFETVFGTSEVAEFAANWVKRWGKNPDGEAARTTRAGWPRSSRRRTAAAAS